MMDDDWPECDCADHAPRGEYWICPKCGAEWFPEEQNETETETPDENISPPESPVVGVRRTD